MTSPLARLIRQACRLEVSARKPGNVHPEASFSDLTCTDFLRAAEVASPWLARASELGVGHSVEAAVRATRAVVPSNANLGIALLIAPLAAVPEGTPLEAGLGPVLARLTIDDSQAVFRAIRSAQPGGMGQVSAQDIAEEPTLPLVEIMRQAADRDRIARQYARGFEDVLHLGCPRLCDWWERTNHDWEQSVIGLHLSLLAEFPDTLIERKCGPNVAIQAWERACHVLDRGWPTSTGSRDELQRFDEWLRADGHRRNPGTTADLVAATLFATLRDNKVPLPDVP